MMFLIGKTKCSAQPRRIARMILSVRRLRRRLYGDGLKIDGSLSSSFDFFFIAKCKNINASERDGNSKVKICKGHLYQYLKVIEI